MSKLAHYSKTIKSNEERVSFAINFNEGELKGYEKFDAFILAKEVNNGELMILSNIVSSSIDSSSGSNKGSNIILVSVLVTLSIVLIVGAIIIFICLRKLKNKPMENAIIAQ